MIKHILFALTFGVMIDSRLYGDEPRPPNLVLIMADDFGYECVTANGGESYQTPHLDRLAAKGMRFSQCHVQPLCTPTRVQLMTGIYNVRNYLEFGLLDPGATTFAHLLKKAGYVTGIAGKWQLGRGKDLPQHFGFDESYLWQHTRRPPRYANPGLEINGEERDYSNGEYGPALINSFALDFITRHKDHPFLLYYPMLLTHDPFQPTPDSPDWNPKAIGEQENRHVKHFGEMTAYMDKLIGRLVAKLDELQLREQTLILFLGDNGTSPAVTSQFEGKPYQGGKGLGNARGTHVPLIANWPGHVPSGRVNDDLVASTDFLPTLCEAARAPVPSSLNIDGQSFLPQLLGEQGRPRPWLYCWYARNGGPTAQVEFVMTARRKLHRDGKFFDLTNDPFEKHPLALGSLNDSETAIAMQLQTALDQFAKARPSRLSHPEGVGEASKRPGGQQ